MVMVCGSFTLHSRDRIALKCTQHLDLHLSRATTLPLVSRSWQLRTSVEVPNSCGVSFLHGALMAQASSMPGLKLWKKSRASANRFDFGDV